MSCRNRLRKSHIAGPTKASFGRHSRISTNFERNTTRLNYCGENGTNYDEGRDPDGSRIASSGFFISVKNVSPLTKVYTQNYPEEIILLTSGIPSTITN